MFNTWYRSGLGVLQKEMFTKKINPLVKRMKIAGIQALPSMGPVSASPPITPPLHLSTPSLALQARFSKPPWNSVLSALMGEQRKIETKVPSDLKNLLAPVEPLPISKILEEGDKEDILVEVISNLLNRAFEESTPDLETEDLMKFIVEKKEEIINGILSELPVDILDASALERYASMLSDPLVAGSGLTTIVSELIRQHCVKALEPLLEKALKEGKGIQGSAHHAMMNLSGSSLKERLIAATGGFGVRFAKTILWNLQEEISKAFNVTGFVDSLAPEGASDAEKARVKSVFDSLIYAACNLPLLALQNLQKMIEIDGMGKVLTQPGTLMAGWFPNAAKISIGMLVYSIAKKRAQESTSESGMTGFAQKFTCEMIATLTGLLLTAGPNFWQNAQFTHSRANIEAALGPSVQKILSKSPRGLAGLMLVSSIPVIVSNLMNLGVREVSASTKSHILSDYIAAVEESFDEVFKDPATIAFFMRIIRVQTVYNEIYPEGQ